VRLRALARGFASRLAATWSRARPTSPMVCVSSASADRGAACAQADLATAIAYAAAARRSYAELVRGFIAHVAASRALHVGSPEPPRLGRTAHVTTLRWLRAGFGFAT